MVKCLLYILQHIAYIDNIMHRKMLRCYLSILNKNGAGIFDSVQLFVFSRSSFVLRATGIHFLCSHK